MKAVYTKLYEIYKQIHNDEKAEYYLQKSFECIELDKLALKN